jgi:hypothetical protein
VLLGENTLHVNYQAFENDDLIKMPGRNAEMVVVGVALSVIVILFVVGLAYVYHRKTRKLRCMRRDLELAAVESRNRHGK